MCYYYLIDQLHSNATKTDRCDASDSDERDVVYRWVSNYLAIRYSDEAAFRRAKNLLHRPC